MRVWIIFAIILPESGTKLSFRVSTTVSKPLNCSEASGAVWQYQNNAYLSGWTGLGSSGYFMSLDEAKKARSFV